MIPGHHPGYISLETYDANIARLAANSRSPPAGWRGRAGRRGLAAGPAALRPVRAAHAGRLPLRRQPRLPVRTGAPDVRRQLLPVDRRTAAARNGAGPSCWPGSPRLPWPPPSRPWPTPRPSTARTWPCSNAPLERARYEADRALRQYDNIEPENRLVARTLEAVLEDKLAAVRTAENQLAAQRARRPVTLTGKRPPGSPPPAPTCGPSSKPRPPPTPSARNSSARSSPRSSPPPGNAGEDSAAGGPARSDHLARRRQHPGADADARQRQPRPRPPAKTPST